MKIKVFSRLHAPLVELMLVEVHALEILLLKKRYQNSLFNVHPALKHFHEAMLGSIIQMNAVKEKFFASL